MQKPLIGTEVSAYDVVRNGRKCSRCGVRVSGGLVGPLSFRPRVACGLEIPIAGSLVVLCEDCSLDVEASVESYGESGEDRGRRFFSVMGRFRAP